MVKTPPPDDDGKVTRPSAMHNGLESAKQRSKGALVPRADDIFAAELVVVSCAAGIPVPRGFGSA
jgi:hypothetical protein